MGLYVNNTDFQGQDVVAKDKYSISDLDIYIDKYEVEFLRELLGAELYTDFAVDFAITGVMPTAPKFQEIWFPFAKDDSCNLITSDGILKMLTLLIYFEYIRDSKVKNNIGGVNINKQVNSEQAFFHETNIYTNYNDAIRTFKAIQWIICDNPNNYDWQKYNGQHKSVNAWI